MSVHCANAGTETISPRIDSSVNNVLLQTNPDFAMQLLLKFINIPERYLANTLLHDSQTW